MKGIKLALVAGLLVTGLSPRAEAILCAHSPHFVVCMVPYAHVRNKEKFREYEQYCAQKVGCTL